MAKRQRGGARPGQRAPLQRGSQPASTPAAKPVVATRPGGLSAGELDRAAELEAAIVAEEREAEAARRRTRAARTTEPVGVARPGSNLAASAAGEYAYVARDVRRVAIVGGSLVGVLILLWGLVQVTGFKPF